MLHTFLFGFSFLFTISTVLTHIIWVIVASVIGEYPSALLSAGYLLMFMAFIRSYDFLVKEEVPKT